MSFYPEPVMARLSQQAGFIAGQWRSENPVPERIHSRELAPDGSLQWHPDFAHWMSRSENRPATIEEGLRTTRVTRKLRKLAVREYEVMYRILMLGDTIGGTASWLNERAARNRIDLPRQYTERDVVALLIAAVDWTHAHW